MLSAILLAMAVITGDMAVTGGDPEGVVATAPETAVDLDARVRPEAPVVEGAARQAIGPRGLTTDQQIERWLSALPPAAEPFADDGRLIGETRKMHGEVNVGVGSHGYRSYGAWVSLPLGSSGRLDLSVQQVENGFGYGPWGRGAYGHPSYGHPAWGLMGSAEREAWRNGDIGILEERDFGPRWSTAAGPAPITESD